MRTLLSALLLCARMAQAQSYTYSFFDPPNGVTNISVTGMNNAGQILVAWTDASQKWHSAIRSPDGTYTPIELPGTIWTWATALNNNGQIAGVYHAASGTHSFVGSADGKSDTSFDVPNTGPSQYGKPAGINDEGEIVATSAETGLMVGLFRSADGSTYTAFSYGSQTALGGINNNGDIAGWGIMDGSYGVRHGFVRSRDGNFRAIEVPGVLAGSQPGGINNRGQIIGSAPFRSC
jgi:hypothetical protein